ncbi:BTB domain and ankyrin repeat protein, variant [Blastomyces dermatitidis ATCC 18188]|uniref:BTB domain and ankyrin repeat protein n=1 Tax=Ajellomyces dermatitidis (strain ATCC 18188 / CBS 674.68) TaxID=653446 RepID=F2T241_AJEDA|nr:BTB domain and ankyrin repeat protein [Blastomyces dermatitidis ATCC 18188]KMW66516.1 BTB domain and ankyrin repeat protein, variant [Blastomyces dermatitidis ATCC 18188]
MSSKLWQYFLQDDAQSFRRFLADATSSHTQWKSNAPTFPGHGGSGTALGTSPGSFLKSSRPTAAASSPKQLAEKQPSSSSSSSTTTTRNVPVTLTRADVNTKDQYGRTLLHLIASSQKETAVDFATALLEVPFVDIYAQDLESGWTALHRALYAGNVTIAQALLARDFHDATDFRTPGGVPHPSGGLIKIKDREGNSPFDVFGATILPRDINKASGYESSLDGDDSVSTDSSILSEAEVAHETVKGNIKPLVNILGDEVFTFGSNKNLNLGLGDEDDRQFPERIGLTRPDHLLYRFNREHAVIRAARRGSDHDVEEPNIDSTAEIPTLVRSRPIIYQQIVMSKLHTGIITNDPESNLFMCGFGSGGRLGTGDEGTRFSFVCIEGGGLAGKKVVSLALGQDHSIAITEQGEVFSWGSNKYGQLGYALPKTNHKDDVPIQTTPRQIFNPFKKEAIIGAAASSIHSVVFTPTGLYTFGKNEGQLGFIDADARSLETQTIPRRVGASLFSSPISMVSAIDRATTCLLENHEVWVFTHYGYSKIAFPLDGASTFIRDSFMSTRYGLSTNHISKITSGGNTICAMSTFGEVYTVHVNRKADTSSTASSTTNPAKIRNSLPQPSRVWSIKKSHMAVRDVDVGQDGSIIICTESGSAWRKEKRAKINDAGRQTTGDARLKDYKFVRIPGLSRVVAVRSNAFGAYAVAQRGCDVAREQIMIDDRSIWEDFWPLLAFKSILRDGDPGDYSSMSMDVVIGNTPIKPYDLESEIESTLEDVSRPDDFQPIVLVSTTASDVRIPVHGFILAGRSPVLRRALAEFHKSYYYSVPDVFGVEYDKNGQVSIKFSDVDFLSIFNLVLYMYADQLYDVWTLARHSPKHATQYKRVRIEVLKLATALELRDLERAVRLMTLPHKRLHLDMERAYEDPNFFGSSDVAIELDGGDVNAHSQILCARCPFFSGLFYGRAGGRWLTRRRGGSPDSGVDPLRIDLKHIRRDIFEFVLRHIYADTDDELFEDVKFDELEDLIDLVIDVMAVANELMLDRLAQICQKLLGRFVNNRNVCHFLNAVAPCSVTAFKQAALEYICLNLEAMLENRLLDDLDDDLFCELDDVCRANQLTCHPVSRGRNSEGFVVERYPEIVPLLERDRQRRIDSMRLRSRLHEDELRQNKFRTGATDKEKAGVMSPLHLKSRLSEPILRAAELAGETSPALKPKQSMGDLIFHMEDDHLLPSGQAGGKQIAGLGISKQSQNQVDSVDVRGRCLQVEGKQQNAGSKARVELSTTPLAKSHEREHAGAPWSSVGPSNTKTGLKDIMAETLGSHPSSTGLNMSPRRDTPATKLTPSKLSQKERKKLQQQQARELTEQQEASKSKSASPWQNVASKPFPIHATARAEAQSARDVSTPVRTASKAPMTLRQTVAGVPSPQNHTPTSKPTPNPAQQKQQHAQEARIPPSTPNASPLPIMKADSFARQTQSATPTTTTPIQPNSRSQPYATIPRIKSDPQQQQQLYNYSSPSPSSTQFSLAYILEQQQIEKDVIREAATAKHKLQDIQLEQEFQEWWDQESRRVREEAEKAEAAAAAAAAARRPGVGAGAGRGKVNRGRGGSAHGPATTSGQGPADRGRRRGGGGAVGNISNVIAATANGEGNATSQLQPLHAAMDGNKRRVVSDRGRGGGRGQHGHGQSRGRGAAGGGGGGGGGIGLRGKGKERAVSTS